MISEYLHFAACAWLSSARAHFCAASLDWCPHATCEHFTTRPLGIRTDGQKYSTIFAPRLITGSFAFGCAFALGLGCAFVAALFAAPIGVGGGVVSLTPVFLW